MTTHQNHSRRTVLASVVLGALGGLAGCLDATGDGGDPPNPFATVAVEGMDLIVEFPENSQVDRVNVIQPDGELFAQRDVAAGVQRERFPMGTSYDPGEYEVLALVDGETVGNEVIEIRPDVRITDVKLARNHPEEMYEGAGEPAILSEAIVTVENQGSGPDSILQLRFEGDVPKPTPEDYPASGIYDADGGIGKHAEEVTIGSNDSLKIISSSRPFSPTGSNISCEESGTHGQFSVQIDTEIGNKDISESFSITYTGSDLFDCEIEIEEK